VTIAAHAAHGLGAQSRAKLILRGKYVRPETRQDCQTCNAAMAGFCWADVFPMFSKKSVRPEPAFGQSIAVSNCDKSALRQLM
jgi:hypothetical protein